MVYLCNVYLEQIKECLNIYAVFLRTDEASTIVEGKLIYARRMHYFAKPTSGM